MKQDVFSICSCGMVPIITHPERNQPLLKNPELVLQAGGAGLPGAGNGQCGDRSLGQPFKKNGGVAAEREAVHVIASDAHDPVRRKPIMSQARDAVAELAGNEVAEALVTHNPAAIVEGKSLPYQPLCR